MIKKLLLFPSLLCAVSCSDSPPNTATQADAAILEPTPDASTDASTVVPAENWIQKFGDDDESQSVNVIGIDKTGNILLSGDYEGDIDFGGGVLASGGRSSVFLAKLTASGEHVWSHTFGDFERQHTLGLATDDDNRIVIVGDFEGEITFGKKELKSAGRSDMFIAAFESDGSPAWSHQFGDSERQFARSVDIDSDGNVIVVGDFSGTVNFGGELLESAGVADVFVAKFDGAGQHLWSKRFGDESLQRGNAVAVDANGNIIITGEMSGEMSFGGEALQGAGGSDIFLAKLGPDGSHQWSQRFGDQETKQSGKSLAIDSAQGISLGATFRGGVDFGGGILEGTTTGDISTDIGIGRFKADGTHQWSQSYGDELPQSVASMTIDTDDNLSFTGQFRGVVTFGGETLESDTHAAYVVTLDVDGKHVATQHIVSGDMKPRAIGTDSWNQRVVVGRFWGDVDLGGKTLSSEAGDYDGFILVLP